MEGQVALLFRDTLVLYGGSELHLGRLDILSLQLCSFVVSVQSSEGVINAVQGGDWQTLVDFLLCLKADFSRARDILTREHPGSFCVLREKELVYQVLYPSLLVAFFSFFCYASDRCICLIEDT